MIKPNFKSKFENNHCTELCCKYCQKRHLRSHEMTAVFNCFLMISHRTKEIIGSLGYHFVSFLKGYKGLLSKNKLLLFYKRFVKFTVKITSSIRQSETHPVTSCKKCFVLEFAMCYQFKIVQRVPLGLFFDDKTEF